MKPIGLRFKLDGELMIVHRCLSCGKLSNNRISGDEIPEIILMLTVEHNNTMNLLTKEHLPTIHDALYGKL